MNNEKSIVDKASVVRCCFTCKSWHRRKNYACQHNGPWGGGTDGIEGCKFKHNGKISPANNKEEKNPTEFKKEGT
jgi:hypothetical protein